MRSPEFWWTRSFEGVSLDLKKEASMISVLFVPAPDAKIPDDLTEILKKKGERTFRILKNNQWGHATYSKTYVQFEGNVARIRGDQEDMFVGSFVGWIIRNANHVSRTFIIELP